MTYRLAADAVVLLHFAFIVFALFGGLLAFWRFWWIWLHLPAVAWAFLIEVTGSICPLTPLENHLRRLAGQQGYEGGFIERYLIPILYPDGLTRELQFALAAIVLLLNAVIYAALLRHRARRQ